MPRYSSIEKNIRKVFVDEMILDLVPKFLQTRTDDLVKLKTALHNHDYDTVRKLGHNWKGAGSTYGFHYLSIIGEHLEILAYRHDDKNLAELLDSLPDYLSSIDIQCKPAYEKLKKFSDQSSHL
jgi:HPt (histidine-containing phosphotransfer) domain-containing protein